MNGFTRRVLLLLLGACLMTACVAQPEVADARLPRASPEPSQAMAPVPAATTTSSSPIESSAAPAAPSSSEASVHGDQVRYVCQSNVGSLQVWDRPRGQAVGRLAVGDAVVIVDRKLPPDKSREPDWRRENHVEVARPGSPDATFWIVNTMIGKDRRCSPISAARYGQFGSRWICEDHVATTRANGTPLVTLSRGEQVEVLLEAAAPDGFGRIRGPGIAGPAFLPVGSLGGLSNACAPGEP